MPELEVPGALLTYDIVGKGPLLLCISGANGDAPIWKMFSEHMKDHFNVVSYDRRGFSRSSLTGSQDYENRLATDANDAAALIKYLSPDQPAIVIGNSSGAIVSLQLLLRHPDCVKLLIPHEPPLLRMSSKWPVFKTKMEAAHATYRRSGPHAGLLEFADVIQIGPERQLLLDRLDTRQSSRAFSNIQYWFEREYLVYPFVDWTINTFKPFRNKLVFVNGDESPKQSPQYLANETLARELETELIILPGGHGGFASHHVKFAEAFLALLKTKGAI